MPARSMRRARERQSVREARRKRRLRGKLAAGAGAALGATVLFVPAAEADTFTVTSLEDDGSEGTLNQEVYDANQLDGDDTIVFASGLTGTITLSGEIDVYYDGLDIQGPGADQITVSGDNAYRIFDFYDFDDPGEQVGVSGLTLTDGSGSDGGAIASSGDVGNAAHLTIANSVLTGNEAVYGGAVWTYEGALTIVNSVITDNVAAGIGGGISQGYGDFNQTEGIGTEITNSVISGNASGGDGGGAALYKTYGDILIENTTVSDNTADDDGAGVFVNDTNDDTGLTIRNSTFSGNDAVYGDGAGLWTRYVTGDTLIENTTLSANRAGFSGGGIHFSYLYEDTTSTIRNSTIVDNVAGIEPGDYGGGGVYLYDDDTDAYYNGPVEISSTIVANNSADFAPDLGQGEESDGFVVGFSLIENESTSAIADSPAGSNITGQDPDLGPLAGNGGLTQTHLPNLTSPVLDAGTQNGLATDQRGRPRTSDLQLVANASGSDGTDIGAVEVQAADVENSCQGAVVRRLAGSDSPDTITGTEGAESIFGLGGDDILTALGANDCVSGGEGNDTADGGAGNDLVDGGEGDDSLAGGDGNDQLTAEGGNDTANGDAGADLISGGDGNDKADGGAGKDQLLGEAGKDNLNGRAGKDTAKGQAGKDRLAGSGGKDKLKGNGGKDRLNGGGGKDKVSGGAGKDKLKGGPGKDKIKGNGGKDKINSVDGTTDKVNCGGGKDKAKVDAIDKAANNCDQLKVKG